MNGNEVVCRDDRVHASTVDLVPAPTPEAIMRPVPPRAVRLDARYTERIASPCRSRLPRALIECMERHGIASADELRAILARRRAKGGDPEIEKIMGNVIGNLITEIGGKTKLQAGRA